MSFSQRTKKSAELLSRTRGWLSDSLPFVDMERVWM